VFEYKPTVAGFCEQEDDPSSYTETTNFLTTEMTITCRKTLFVIYKNSFPSDYASGRLWNRLRPILYLIELFSFGFSLVHLKTPIQRVPWTLSVVKIRGVKLTIHLHRVTRLVTSGTIHPLPRKPSRCIKDKVNCIGLKEIIFLFN
jgi:hypothetical protein